MIGGSDLFIGMFNNLAVSIVFISLYSFLKPYPMQKYLKTLCICTLFVITLLVCMRVKIPVAEGVLVDQRNGIIVLSTLFGGPVSGLMTLLAGTAMRIYLGGIGVPAGAIGMAMSLGAGFLLRQWKGERNLPFFLMGSFIAVLIIIPGFLFVGDLPNGWNLLRKMAIPYGIPLYLGMIFIGLLLQHVENRIYTSQKLSRSEKKYRTLYENLIDISYQIDTEGIIQEMSPSVKEILRYESKELIGIPITKLYKNQGERSIFLYELKHRGYVNNYELTLLGKDDSESLVSINSAADLDDSRNIIGYHGIIRDITRLRSEQLQKEQLEKIVYQSQKMDALGTLAGGVAHDFNNILAAVLGFAELIKQNANDRTSVQEFADQILQAAERATCLIKQILLFSRETTSKSEEIEIKPLIDEALGLLRHTIPKTVIITFEDGKVRERIKGDSNQLHQVILNLVTNAFHALPDEKGHIIVKTGILNLKGSKKEKHTGLEEGNYLSLSIEDDAKGIPEKDQPNIFNPFFTTKKKGKGTGLGLSVVHGIIKKHKGEISLSSKVGQGTIFTVLLPLSNREKSEDEIKTQLEDWEELPRGKERIMILDDERSIVQVEKNMLAFLGYNVSIFTDPQIARSELLDHGNAYDLLLTDQSMPEVSGLELAGEILKKDNTFPVIIVTGYSSVLDADKAMAMGVKDILIKPVSHKKLALAVREALFNID